MKNLKTFFSLMVGVSLMCGCTTGHFHKQNNTPKSWNDYFDGNDFKSVNENSQNQITIKHKN